MKTWVCITEFSRSWHGCCAPRILSTSRARSGRAPPVYGMLELVLGPPHHCDGSIQPGTANRDGCSVGAESTKTYLEPTRPRGRTRWLCWLVMSVGGNSFLLHFSRGRNLPFCAETFVLVSRRVGADGLTLVDPRRGEHVLFSWSGGPCAILIF